VVRVTTERAQYVRIDVGGHPAAETAAGADSAGTEAREEDPA